MKNTHAERSARDRHYYSDGRYLREKHRLAGDKFVKWACSFVPDPASATILDAGGGWGRFAWALVDHFGADTGKIVLTDLSVGMLLTAQEEAVHRQTGLVPALCNIEALPFAAGRFDVVMANHVLYHLADLRRGVRELARVVKPGGCLLATTNSDKITATVIALHYQALDVLKIAYEPELLSPFSMENGGDLLAAAFGRAEAHYYEDEDLIYDAAKFRATYENTGRYRSILFRDDVPEQTKQDLPRVFESLAQEIIGREGVLRSPNMMGVFVCREPVI